MGIRRRIRKAMKSARPPSVLMQVDYTADEPLVHYSTDGGASYRISSVEEFERNTGCTVTFSEPQA